MIFDGGALSTTGAPYLFGGFHHEAELGALLGVVEVRQAVLTDMESSYA